MPQGPSIKPVTGLIVETYMEMYTNDPNITAKEVAHEVRSRLREKYQARRFPKDWPGDSAVGKIITDIKKNRDSLFSNPIDEPWTLSTLNDYFIPPEALPAILQLQAEAIKWRRQLTIRKAIWVGRFYHICREMIANHPDAWEKEHPLMDALDCWAEDYSRVERHEEVLTLIDKLPSKEDRLRTSLLLDAHLYLNLSFDDKSFEALWDRYAINDEYEFIPGLEFTSLAYKEFEEYLQGLRRKPSTKGGDNERSHTETG